MLVNQKGFTIVEMMIVIAIVGILASLAMPSFSEMIAASQVKSAASDLQMSLMRTRSEAGKRNANITLTPAAGGWAAGWTIEQGIETHAAVTAVITGPASVIYTPSGRTTVGQTSFNVSAVGTATVRCVQVGLNGQPAIKQQACS